jgi:hypothetical protein
MARRYVQTVAESGFAESAGFQQQRAGEMSFANAVHWRRRNGVCSILVFMLPTRIWHGAKSSRP